MRAFGRRPRAAAADLRDSADAAFQCACRLLGYRDRSTAELTAKLRERGFSPKAVETALHLLTERNLLDDQRFARSYRDIQLRRGRSLRLIVQELKRTHGIEELPPDPDEDPDAGILAILRRRFGHLPDSPAVRRRITGFLLRRGFDYDSIRRLSGILQKRIANADQDA